MGLALGDGPEAESSDEDELLLEEEELPEELLLLLLLLLLLEPEVVLDDTAVVVDPLATGGFSEDDACSMQALALQCKHSSSMCEHAASWGSCRQPQR